MSPKYNSNKKNHQKYKKVSVKGQKKEHETHNLVITLILGYHFMCQNMNKTEAV